MMSHLKLRFLQAARRGPYNRAVTYSPPALLGLTHGEHSSQVEPMGLERFHSSGTMVLARCFPRARSNRPGKCQITLASPNSAVDRFLYFRMPILKPRIGVLRCKTWWQAHLPAAVKSLHSVAVDSVAADGDLRSSSVAAASTPCPAQAFLAEPDESAAQQSSLAEATLARTTGTFGVVKQRPLTSHIAAKPAAAVMVY